jgi:hypothetical protein
MPIGYFRRLEDGRISIAFGCLMCLYCDEWMIWFQDKNGYMHQGLKEECLNKLTGTFAWNYHDDTLGSFIYDGASKEGLCKEIQHDCAIHIVA